MTALNLREMVAHGRKELAQAEAIVLQHRPEIHGMCHCLRATPCDARAKFAAYTQYWRARLDVLEPQLAALTAPTTVLATVSRRRWGAAAVEG